MEITRTLILFLRRFSFLPDLMFEVTYHTGYFKSYAFFLMPYEEVVQTPYHTLYY